MIQKSILVSGYSFAHAAEDKVEEEDEVVLDTEGSVVVDEATKDEDLAGSESKRSSDADTIIIFTNPPGSGSGNYLIVLLHYCFIYFFIHS